MVPKTRPVPRWRGRTGALFAGALLAAALFSGPPLEALGATPALFSDNPVTVPDEIDIGVGVQDWFYRETAGDSDNAGLLEGHLRSLSYLGPVILGADLSYMASFTGQYTGATLQTGAPLTMPMAETVFQSAIHLGFLVLNTSRDILGLWGTYGYHQQIWMTPAQSGGYEENYQIPYVGVALYNQNPIPSSRWIVYEEAGYRSGIGPSVAITPSAGQSIPQGTLNLGSVWNVHGLVGARVLLTPHIGLYVNGNYSYWAFTQSTNTLASSLGPLVEPSSLTSYFGMETGVTIAF